ncbi:hypothetical protein GCM10009115_06450 [Sphingopyxis soli]|uniref:HNH nuclease domain-containing protein n=1 Tax=Sphingopyxis soli TaxID=592051 RepID=A0ABN1LYL9_9SPHN|nr:DUF262 domain-containing protein [Sphingopyxis soli]
MPAKTVNLDALIPREDFVGEIAQAGGSPRTTISLSDLGRQGFFQANLRKPDFQRETGYWTPNKVVDLVKAFLDRDLIPAVILWQRGDEVFVIDGAHRLSALIAWVRDDYGDGEDSNRLFGAGLTDEQRAVAKKTRDLMKKEIGTYAEFNGLIGKTVPDPRKARRLASIGQESLIIQWVTAATPEAAEASFFKINQAAQPIDPVERRILQSRTSPNAIASRCIVRGGQGHKYWASFDDETRKKIEELGEKIHADLYKPPHKNPVTSADQPIAGQGYNSLPFVFDLVSLCNGINIPATPAAKIEALEPDLEGVQTLAMLSKVNERIETISTNSSGSLGLHPLVYFYARSGNFIPNAFLASLQFAKKLHDHKKKKAFTSIRRDFEDFLFAHKVFVSLTITRLGSGSRSLQRIADLYWALFEGFEAGNTGEEIVAELVKQGDFVHLRQAEIPSPGAVVLPGKKGASHESKSAAFIREAMANPVRCPICQAAVHSNSITFDHLQRRREGGNNDGANLAPAHPFCNSGVKN